MTGSDFVLFLFRAGIMKIIFVLFYNCFMCADNCETINCFVDETSFHFLTNGMFIMLLFFMFKCRRSLTAHAVLLKNNIFAHFHEGCQKLWRARRNLSK